MFARQHMNFRISQTGTSWIERMVRETTDDAAHPTTRSDVIRAALAIATRHEEEVKTWLSERL